MRITSNDPLVGYCLPSDLPTLPFITVISRHPAIKIKRALHFGFSVNSLDFVPTGRLIWDFSICIFILGKKDICRFDTILAVSLKFRFYLRVVALPP